MDQHIEVAIIVTNEDGTRSATVLHNRPNFLPRKPGFIYNYLRTTTKSDAPPHFRFGVLDNEQATEVAALADHSAKDHEEAMARMIESLKLPPGSVT
jgi:hypothetical protein